MENKYIKNNYIVDCIGEEKYKQCAYFIKNSKNITFLVGAGLSTNSGIPCFRSNDGIYTDIPESFFTLSEFEKNPERFYKLMETLFLNKKPNKGHYLIKELQDTYKDKNINILTQNIDNLSEVIGAENVIHIHGNINEGYCINCGKKIEKLNFSRYRCNCITGFNKYTCSTENGLIRPNIVFYDEYVMELDKSIEMIKNTDLLIILGTSLIVEPVASLPKLLKADSPIIIINEEATYLDEDRMSIVFNEDIIKALSKIINYI